MPAVNPRISITVPAYRHDLLKRLAGLQGVSVSSLVGELLEEFYPVLERVCIALERAKHAQESSKAGVREAADRAIAEMGPLLDSVSAQADLFFSRVDAALGGSPGVPPGAPIPAGNGGPGGAPGRVAGGANPRVVTRGSGLIPESPPKGKRAGSKSTPKPREPSQGKASRGGAVK